MDTRSTSYDRFEAGDRVEHSFCGKGTVSAIKADGIHVTFDKVGASGKPWCGVYDRDWFRTATATLRIVLKGEQ